MAYRRSCIALEFEDGTSKIYGDLNSAPSKPGRLAGAEKVAAELERLIAAQPDVSQRAEI
jgi:hypothetical protein